MKWGPDGSLLPEKSTLCRILGHKWHPEGAEFYSVYDCMRCTYSGNGNEWNLRSRLKLWVYWRIDAIRDRWFCFRQWIKCSECGERFGKHNDAFDHLPF